LIWATATVTFLRAFRLLLTFVVTLESLNFLSTLQSQLQPLQLYQPIPPIGLTIIIHTI